MELQSVYARLPNVSYYIFGRFRLFIRHWCCTRFHGWDVFTYTRAGMHPYVLGNGTPAGKVLLLSTYFELLDLDCQCHRDGVEVDRYIETVERGNCFQEKGT